MSASVGLLLAWATGQDVFFFRSIRDALTSGPQRAEVLWLLAGALAVLLLIVLSARFLNRDRNQSTPTVDYLTLAVDVLGLSESDRRLLKGLARAADLPQPVAMLLSPANLAAAVEHVDESPEGDKLRAGAESLCRRLFGTPLPTLGQRVLR